MWKKIIQKNTWSNVYLQNPYQSWSISFYVHQSFFEPRHCITISWIPGGTPLNRNVSLGVDTMGADASSSSKSSHDSTSPGVDTGSGCAESKRRKGQHFGTTAPNSTANQYNTSMYGILAYIWLLLMVNPGKKYHTWMVWGIWDIFCR